MAAFLFGGGGAWSVPTEPAGREWLGGRARQDFALSGLAQITGRALTLQIEFEHGGFSASVPDFTGFFARGGLVLPAGGPVRLYFTAGGGVATMNGKSIYDCEEFGCDARQGSGFAFSVEAGALIKSGNWAIDPYFQALLPLFDVSAFQGEAQTQTVPLLLFGARILFEP